ncbi:MAG: hypothetical protein J6D52_11960 [Clostridia bacterium]|nr:hypothetical protein [Clostridia bacterium]
MKTTGFVTRILVIATLCICLCVVPSFGPRLSEAAALTQPTLGTISQTDVVPPASSAQENSGVQVKNILSVISLTVGNIYNVRFHLEVFPLLGIDNTQFQFYDYNEEDESIISFTDNTDSNGELEVVYEPNLQRDVGVPFLYCGYNTTDDVALAKRAIVHTIGYGEMTEDFVINSGDNYVLTNTRVLMGDVNGDNVVDSSDSSLVSSAVTDSSSLTQYEFLAADVNRDGSITTKDTLSVMKYVQGTLTSFWGTNGIVPLTLSSTIQNDNVYRYRLFNEGSDKFLITNRWDGIGMTSTPTSIETNFLDIDNPNNLFVIKNIITNSYLALDYEVNPYHVWFTDQPENNSQYWYIVQWNSNYYLVNFCYPDRVLSDDLTLKRSLHNAQWDLQPKTITVDYYYNYGYRYRFWNGWENKSTVAKTSSQVDAAVVSHLQGYQTTIDNVLTKTFGIDVIMNTPELICSNEDLCYAPNSNPTFSQMVSAIGNSQIADQSATHTACTHASPTLCEIGMPHHHRNGSAGLDYMVDKREENGEADHIYLLTSGYDPCDVRTRTVDEDEDGSVNHAYDVIAGLAFPLSGVCGVYHDDYSNSTHRNNLTALHELGHCLGAGGKADTEHGLTCVMSYNRSNSDLLETMNNQSLNTYRALFCDDCYNAIVNGLNFQ